MRTLRPAFILLFAALLYGYALTRTMQYDEAFTYFNYTERPVQVLIYSLPNNHILHSALVWLSRQALGDSHIAVRFPAFIMALVSVALVYRLAGKLAGRDAATLASVMFATLWCVMDYATQARGYTLVMALTLVMVHLILFPCPYRRRWHYAVMATSAALILTLPTMVFLIGSIILCERLYHYWLAR